LRAAYAFEVRGGLAGGLVLAGGEDGGVGYFGCDVAEAGDRGGPGDGGEAAGVALGGGGEVVEQGCDFGRFEDREQAAEGDVVALGDVEEGEVAVEVVVEDVGEEGGEGGLCFRGVRVVGEVRRFAGLGMGVWARFGCLGFVVGASDVGGDAVGVCVHVIPLPRESSHAGRGRARRSGARCRNLRARRVHWV
jgi:hypothetical protein